MSVVKTKILAFLVVLSGILIPVLFQNCSQVHFKGLPSSITNKSIEECTDPSCEELIIGVASCEFNGEIIASGQRVTAYRESSGECVSEERVCDNGLLSGSYQYAACDPNTPKSCLFGTRTIPHGGRVTAFQNGAEPCTSEERVCNDGVLSGSFQFEACTPDTPSNCLFNGETINHGAVVRAFQNPSVPFGETCIEEFRLCTNGSLNGSYQYASCDPGAPSACLFQGITVPHGAKHKAFQNSSVPIGESCVEEERECNNGVLSGSYNHLTCEPGGPASCTFDGRTLADGEKVIAFRQSTAPFGEACESEERVCRNGVLSGTFPVASCNEDQAKTCKFNGRTLAHGEKVKAFQTSTVPYGQSCSSQDRVCNNGILSGSYTYSSCDPGSPASCTFNTRTIAHGEKVKAYQTSTVPYGQSCSSQDRVCNNGILNGSYTFADCDMGAPASCLFNGATIPHEGQVPAASTASVPWNGTCQWQNRSCSNGVLGGTYAYANCQKQTALNCTFNGRTVNHNTTTTWYVETNPAAGVACQSQQRSCTNGVLSGSSQYKYANCTPTSGRCDSNMVRVDGVCVHVTTSCATKKATWGSEARQGKNSSRVAWFYCEFLGRLPEQAGFDFWLDQLNSGRRAQFCADAMSSAINYEQCSRKNSAVNSSAANSCYDSQETRVQNAYRYYLKRANVHENEVSFWAKAMRDHGGDLWAQTTYLATEICKSTEFKTSLGYGPYF